MGHVVLLGDSIFDNAAYVRGRPAVIDQVRSGLPQGWRASLNAVDGHTTRGVYGQLEKLPVDASHLVLSVGGNDALGQAGVLGARASGVAVAVRLLDNLREGFDLEYNRLLAAISGRGLPAAVCTVYNPRYADPEAQRVYVTALCLFNDAIIRAAHQPGFPVIDLRAICTTDADYANPIEPSSAGGAKIARAICDLVTGHDFRRRQTILLPELT
jgi:hypothetical protein